jgi:hypothetical protein
MIRHRMPSLGVSSLDLGRFRAALFFRTIVVAQAAAKTSFLHRFGAQELAEFIDPVETVAPRNEGGDFLEYDPETS